MHLVALRWAFIFTIICDWEPGSIPNSSFNRTGICPKHAQTHVDVCLYTSICYIISIPSGLIVTGHVSAFPGKPQKAWGCFWFVDIIMIIPSSSNFDLENPCKVQANAHPPNCCTVVQQAHERNPATMAMQNPFEGNALPPYPWGTWSFLHIFWVPKNIISISFYTWYMIRSIKESSDLNGHLHSSKTRGSTFPQGKLGVSSFPTHPPIHQSAWIPAFCRAEGETSARSHVLVDFFWVERGDMLL